MESAKFGERVRVFQVTCLRAQGKRAHGVVKLPKDMSVARLWRAIWGVLGLTGEDSRSQVSQSL